MNNNEVISILNDLVLTCKQGQDIFRKAADSIQNSEFRRLFNIFSQQRAQFISELQSEVHRLGGETRTESASDAASLPNNNTVPFRSSAAKAAVRDEASIIAE